MDNYLVGSWPGVFVDLGALGTLTWVGADISPCWHWLTWASSCNARVPHKSPPCPPNPRCSFRSESLSAIPLGTWKRFGSGPELPRHVRELSGCLRSSPSRFAFPCCHHKRLRGWLSEALSEPGGSRGSLGMGAGHKNLHVSEGNPPISCCHSSASGTQTGSGQREGNRASAPWPTQRPSFSMFALTCPCQASPSSSILG